MINADVAWRLQLERILENGVDRSPRGKRTLDVPNGMVVVDMRRPVVTTPERKLSYQFMAAEAHWILSGSDKVADIAPWNKNISQFSDDGVKFFGAYGPKIAEQLPYVIAKLKEDPHTRQAGLTIWRESPPRTKDVPCTVAMFFGLCDNELDAFVFMRSSDAWLGLPYDIFNFSMVAHLICSVMNTERQFDAIATGRVPGLVIPGTLYLTMASSHLYEEHFEAAQQIVKLGGPPSMQPRTPAELWDSTGNLLHVLAHLRDSKAGDPSRWWNAS